MLTFFGECNYYKSGIGHFAGVFVKPADTGRHFGQG